MTAVVIPVDFFERRAMTMTHVERLEWLKHEVAELEHVKIMTKAEMQACQDRARVLLENYHMIDKALSDANQALQHYMEVNGSYLQ